MKPSVRASSVEGLRSELKDLRRLVMDLKRDQPWNFDDEVAHPEGGGTTNVSAGWTSVVSLGTQASGSINAGKPTDWADGDAEWIWHASGTRPDGEKAWLAGTVDVTIDTPVTIEVAADNGATVWLNGVLLGSLGVTSGSSTVGFDTRTVYTATLRVGTNELAFEATNGSGGGNPAGVLASVKRDSDSLILLRSTDAGGWYAWTAQPARWPTPGPGGFAGLDDLTDVDVSSPADGMALVYDSTTGMWQPETVGASGSGLLTVVTYDPASETGVATTSQTFADIDATNLAVGFTVPDSGRVLVRLQARGSGTGGNWLQWNLREGSSDVANTDHLIEVGGAGSHGRATLDVLVSGLTPGAAKTYKWGHAVHFGSSPAQTTFGGLTGPAIMQVWAA